MGTGKYLVLRTCFQHMGTGKIAEGRKNQLIGTFKETRQLYRLSSISPQSDSRVYMAGKIKKPFSFDRMMRQKERSDYYFVLDIDAQGLKF